MLGVDLDVVLPRGIRALLRQQLSDIDELGEALAKVYLCALFQVDLFQLVNSVESNRVERFLDRAKRLKNQANRFALAVKHHTFVGQCRWLGIGGHHYQRDRIMQHLMHLAKSRHFDLGRDGDVANGRNFWIIGWVKVINGDRDGIVAAFFGRQMIAFFYWLG